MSRLLSIFLMCAVSVPLLTQAPKPLVSTVTAVRPHESGSENRVLQYEVSLRVGDTVYVVLYTPPNESKGAEYAIGQTILIRVNNETITFTKLGNTFEVPILRRDQTDDQKKIDWSRIPGEYFEQKLQHLSEKLDLTATQQKKIKPILEQEAGEAGMITANSVLSSKDKFERLETIVVSSDQKLKPILTMAQWETLQSLRKQQKQQLKEQLEARMRAQ